MYYNITLNNIRLNKYLFYNFKNTLKDYIVRNNIALNNITQKNILFFMIGKNTLKNYITMKKCSFFITKNFLKILLL